MGLHEVVHWPLPGGSLALMRWFMGLHEVVHWPLPGGSPKDTEAGLFSTVVWPFGPPPNAQRIVQTPYGDCGPREGACLCAIDRVTQRRMSQKSTPVPFAGARPACLVISFLAGCGGLIDPDPYTGTMDPSGFYRLYKFQPSSSEDPAEGCLLPRMAWDGTTLADASRFYYMGGLFAAQLDLSGAFDTSRALPPAVYSLTGCDAPEGRQDPGEFDIRVHNYDKRLQYPILSQGLFPSQVGGSGEPTATDSKKPDNVPLLYKPFHVVVLATLGQGVRSRMGCNDVKHEVSLLERAGWDRSSKAFPDDGPKDIDFSFPSREQMRSGAARFKDWPMVNVGVPIGRSLDAALSCPFVKNSRAVYPKTLHDPDSTFVFPAQSWFRGLLSGYLDGGEVAVVADARKCPALFDSKKACSIEAGTPTGCNFTDGEVCTAKDAATPGTCLQPPPVCPAINELYVSKDEYKVLPTSADFKANDPLPRSQATVKLVDAVDPQKSRVAQSLAIFAVAPGQPGFSPVCRVHWVDFSKLTCAAKETDPIKPRPLCTLAEIRAVPAAITDPPLGKDVFVHCVSLASAK